MTRHRRRKVAIRTHQAAAAVPYTLARRQLGEPASAKASVDAVPPGVEVLPPLGNWTRPVQCRWWADTAVEHGPLMAVMISAGAGWWDLDDLVRDVVGAGQSRPADQRDLWINLTGSSYVVTKREHLPGIAEVLAAAGALSRLTVRAVPDAAHCDHPSCRRRRGEPAGAGPAKPRTPAVRARTEYGPLLSLAEVMQLHPHLSYRGIDAYRKPSRTHAQWQAELAEERRQLASHESSIVELANWLRTSITPIKTPTVGSYGMKHVAENALGTYVSNGELIAAALMACYPHRYYDGPNLAFGMSARDVRRVRESRTAANQ
ncbi:hypothetical protein [Nocardia brasiliensis]|uniref:hypothetical protein n=1 Tax=Nocardia brasiliensis TaxID=37326 RepID=UPI00245492A2|nr:hypothetical protein [Nocardia brasiliensis]